MSLKNVDLQIAVQRQDQASRIQQQMNREGQMMNLQAAQTVQKQEEQKMRTVQRREETAGAVLRPDERQRHRSKKKKERRRKERERKRTSHPYKGKFIDTSG